MVKCRGNENHRAARRDETRGRVYAGGSGGPHSSRAPSTYIRERRSEESERPLETRERSSDPLSRYRPLTHAFLPRPPRNATRAWFLFSLFSLPLSLSLSLPLKLATSFSFSLDLTVPFVDRRKRVRNTWSSRWRMYGFHRCCGETSSGLCRRPRRGR